MDVLLRELRTDRDGTVERHDTEFSGDRILLGSAPDANVQLLGANVAGRHATISTDGQRLQLRCGRSHHIRHNGADVQTAQLSIGDVVELGGNRLTVTAAPAGFHFAIEIQLDPDVDASQFEAAFQTDLEQTAISKRRMSWVAVGAVLVLGFALPLVGALLRDPKTAATPLMPSDAFWSSGDLSAAHTQASGARCASCHRDLFERVRDTECRECHQSVADHLSGDRAGLAHIETQRCATCHREHGSHGELIPSADGGCTACHANASSRFAELKMSDVHAFEPEEHPPFAARLSLPSPVAGVAGAIEWRTVKLPLAEAREHSNLKFSHKQHLDADKVIRDSDGKGLNCHDCHRPLDAERFTPVTMQSSCASCHALSFDAANPERQLPHAKPREAILALQEYFARRYADPAAAPVVRERRRLPGRTREAIECTGSALACARQAADNEIEAQFTQSGCVTCHEVSDTRSADIYERYQVLPIRLSADFLPTARFDHVAHRVQEDHVGDAACLTCHKANTADLSAELLLPSEAHCMECHRSNPSGKQIASPCAACHAYHPRNAAAVAPGSQP